VRKLADAAPTDAATAHIETQARALVDAIRRRRQHASGLDALLGEYDLSSTEGIVLMCLAEALLRIPDPATADRLIADKLGAADWHAHLGTNESLFVKRLDVGPAPDGPDCARGRGRRAPGELLRAPDRPDRRTLRAHPRCGKP